MNQYPVISVIMPAYNAAFFIEEAIESILAQTCSDWELIIVDDGSADETLAIINKYTIKEPRIQCFSKQNEGPSAARNFAIHKSTGIYILPVDADDKLSDNYLMDCLNIIENSIDVTVVYGDGKKFGMVNESIKRVDYDWDTLLFGNMIHVSGMYRKSDWQAIGGYDEAMREGVEDWEFWINLLKPGKKAIKLKSIIFYQRINNVSRTTKLHDSGAEKRMRQYVYCKHASLYNGFFIDPLKTYQERNYYKELWQWAEQHPVKFFLSRVKKKYKI